MNEPMTQERWTHIVCISWAATSANDPMAAIISDLVAEVERLRAETDLLQEQVGLLEGLIPWQGEPMTPKAITESEQYF